MVMVDAHDCRQFATERMATWEDPYHFTESGLTNVYLAGIRCTRCAECDEESAEIPAIEELLRLMAGDVVLQESPLAGEEIRFLRKRLGLRAKDFAAAIHVDAAHLSRLEAGVSRPSGALDRLIRLVYAMGSGDAELMSKIAAQVMQFLASIERRKKRPRIFARLDQHDGWYTETVAA